jgi:branched-chain amino acid transport system ATP-binding protein
MQAHEIINSGIARTFQNIRLFGSMTVLDNVKVAYFGHTRYGILDTFINSNKKRNEEKEIQEEALALLNAVGIMDKADVPASSLPYGDQRRLEIARALACKPEILLLDEPAAGMNPNEIDELNKTIVAIKEKFGLTILLVEHQMRLIMGICERIIVMNFGKSLAIGTPSEIRNHKDVLEAYLGKVHKNEK